MSALWRRYHLAVVAAKYGGTAWLTDELARRLVPADRLSAVFVALICCQPSLVASAKRGWEQLFASAVGVGGSLVLLAILPHTSWTLGLAAAVTYAIGSVLQWPYATLVVALFSSIYMSLYPQTTLHGTALLRCEAVTMGVLAALLANLVFSPAMRRANLDVRVHRALGLVRDRLAELLAVMRAGEPAAIRGRLADWERSFGALAELEDELADLHAESRISRRGGHRTRGRGLNAEAAARELEQLLHYGLDIGGAVARMQEAPPADGPMLVGEAVTSLERAIAALERLDAGDLAAGATLARTELDRVRELDRAVAPPDRLEERLGPRLVVLVGLAELHQHLGRLAEAMERLVADGEVV